MEHIKKKIEQRYGSVPRSLEKVFDTDAEDMFLHGVEEAVTKRKSDAMGRYVDIARIVFGFFNHLYEYMQSLSYRDKISLLSGSKISLTYWDNLLEKVESILNSRTMSCNCKVNESLPLLEHYDHVLSLLNERNPNIQNYLFSSHHFKSKLLMRYHTFMTEHFYNAFQEEAKQLGLEDSVAKILIIMEGVMYGIDDYVDMVDQDENEAFADVVNLTFSLFGLIYYLLKTYKLSMSDRVLSLSGRQTRLQQFLDNIVYLTTDQTEIPFVERDILRVLEIDDEVIEHEFIDKNLRVRAMGAVILANSAAFMLVKEKDPQFMAIIDTVTTYRMLELLSKDILDIEEDVLQGKHTPPSVWAFKHGKNSKEFKDRIRKLADTLHDEAKDKYPKISRYKNVRDHYKRQIRNKHTEIMNRL